jgi:hypothetical protein
MSQLLEPSLNYDNLQPSNSGVTGEKNRRTTDLVLVLVQLWVRSAILADLLLTLETRAEEVVRFEALQADSACSCPTRSFSRLRLPAKHKLQTTCKSVQPQSTNYIHFAHPYSHKSQITDILQIRTVTQHKLQTFCTSVQSQSTSWRHFAHPYSHKAQITDILHIRTATKHKLETFCTFVQSQSTNYRHFAHPYSHNAQIRDILQIRTVTKHKLQTFCTSVQAQSTN